MKKKNKKFIFANFTFSIFYIEKFPDFSQSNE